MLILYMYKTRVHIHMKQVYYRYISRM